MKIEKIHLFKEKEPTYFLDTDEGKNIVSSKDRNKITKYMEKLNALQPERKT